MSLFISCNRCGSSASALADVSEQLKVFGEIFIVPEGRKKGVYLKGLNIDLKSSNAELKLICSACRESLEENDFEIECFQCWKKIPLKDARVARSSNGFYCPECLKEVLGEQGIKADKFLEENVIKLDV